MYLCTYINLYMYTFVYSHIFIYIHKFIYIYIHKFIYIYICIHIFIHNIYRYIYTFTHMYIHEYEYMITYTHMYIYIYNFVYIKIYIQVLEDPSSKSRAHAVALHDIGMLMTARVTERRGRGREREGCHHQSVHAWLALHHADEREKETERESVWERERERKRCPSARARRCCAPRRSADEKEQERERESKQARIWEREREREREVSNYARTPLPCTLLGFWWKRDTHERRNLLYERHDVLILETWLIHKRDMTYW